MICKCGHEESLHGKWEHDPNHAKACLAKRPYDRGFACLACLEFKADNLKYLEMEYEKRHKAISL